MSDNEDDRGGGNGRKRGNIKTGVSIPDMTKLYIKPFNPSTKLKHDRIIFLIGRRGSGKSVLERDLLYYMRDKLDMGIAITKTLGSEDMFKACMPHETVKREFLEHQIEAIIKHQSDHAREVGRDNIRRVFVLLDDMMYDKSIFKGTVIRDVFMNGRHYNLFFVNSMQYCMDISVDMRSQIDYVFAMWEPNAKNRRRLWENFFGIFENYNQFEIVFKSLTGNYGALVIDNTTNSTKIEDSIFWYRAKPNAYTDFKIGNDVFWALSRKFYISPEEQSAKNATAKAQGTTKGNYNNAPTSTEMLKKRKLHMDDVVRANEDGQEYDDAEEDGRKRSRGHLSLTSSIAKVAHAK
jgi:hypothetical protein